MASTAGIVVATIAFGMGIDKARRPLRLPLQPAQEPGELQPGDRPRRARRRALDRRDARLPRRRARRWRTSPTATRPTRGGAAGAGRRAPRLRARSFDVSLAELSGRHDLRPLVLRTALTYLELLGVLRQGTPFYAGYELRPLLEPPEIAAQFQGERARFVADALRRRQEGPHSGTRSIPDEVAAALGPGAASASCARWSTWRSSGWAELRAVGRRASAIAGCGRARTRKRWPASWPRRFDTPRGAGRSRDSSRCSPSSRTTAVRPTRWSATSARRVRAPCGHCTYCLTGRRQQLPGGCAPPRLPAGLDVAAFTALRGAQPGALGSPRQVARFLCGLSSPGADVGPD